MKALHPADPLTTPNGIPDLCSIPSVFQNFSSSYTIVNPLPSNTGNWDFDVFFYAHPVFLGAVRTVDALGAVTWSAILNPHLTGTTTSEKRDFVFNQWEKYRIAYLGITGYHDAAALSNNGLIASAQYPQTPEYTTYFEDLETSVPYYYLTRRAELWPQTLKTFEQLQNLPNAYFGAARDGVYCPYKLSETCQDWVSAKDLVLHFASSTSQAFLPSAGAYNVPIASPMEGPYGIVGSNRTTLYTVQKRCDDGVIHISGRQFASAASFTCYYRSGFEVQVTPGSTISSFAKTSPPHDATALSTYFSISRELKDAYPAEYNDLGKIVRTIADAAADVLPTIFPGLGPIVRAAHNTINRIFPDKAKGDGQPKTDNVSAATKERVSKVVTMPGQIKLRHK